MSFNIHIEQTLNPSNKDIDFLTCKINQETAKFGGVHPFAFFIRNDQKNIIAGCNCYVIFGVIYTDQLWVDVTHRRQGLGTALMERVHEYGRQSGCNMATIATMSFLIKARKFYEKLLYKIDFKRSGYAGKYSYIFLSKNL